ncbi:MAG: tetratricopeptide repeat protein, partial [Myxococcota bacterium]
PVSAVEEMVLYRVQPGERATALSERLHQESEGNPFIVLQMLNGLEAAGVIHNRTVQMTAALLAHAPLPIPRSLKEALERKLSALSTSGLVVARLVALSRVEVDDELLALAAPALPDAERDATIDALLDAEVLKERRVGATERFELIHLRLQDVIIEDIPEDVSRALHRQLGVALEQRSRHNVEPIVELLAHHFDQGDVPSKAYSYLVWAAEKLQGQAFTMSALRMLQRAVALEPRARPYMPLVEADKRKTRVLLSQSNVLYHLGRWEEALEVAQQADTYARGLDDDALLARTATELASQARALGQYAEAEAELDRALKHAALANEGRLQIVPLYERGAMRWGAGDLSAARALFEEALQLSERYQDGRGLALGSNGLGVLAMCEGQSAAARRYFERAIEVCEQHDLMERLAIARTNLAELSHCMGNIRKGLSLADRTITDAREVDHRSGVGIGLRYRALLLGDLGRWAEAEENAREAIRIQQKLGSQDEELASSVALARVVLGRGDDNRAPALLDNSLKLAEQHDTEGYLPVIRAWRSQLMAAAGDKDAAIEELNAAAGAGHNWPHQKLRQLLNAARAWKMVDAPETAIELAESALRLAETCGYRYYAMRARQLLADTLEKEASVSRHQRVAEALARSLAANLPAEDGAAFLLQQGLQPQTLHRRRLRTRTNSTS